MDDSIEIFAVMAVTTLAVISPGPDFALTLNTALTHGKKAGIKTSFGIGFGVAAHVTYTLLGLGVLLQNSPLALDVIRYSGAAYLLWLGFSRISKSFSDESTKPTIESVDREFSNNIAWPFLSGFLCNLLNPKTVLFIVAIFSQLVSETTPIHSQIFYGLFIILSHTAWFSLVTSIASLEPVRIKYTTCAKGVDRVSAGFIILFGASIAFR